MDARSTFILSLSIHSKTNLICHYNTMVTGPSIHKRPIKGIPIVSYDDARLDVLNMAEETTQQTHLRSHDPVMMS